MWRREPGSGKWMCRPEVFPLTHVRRPRLGVMGGAFDSIHHGRRRHPRPLTGSTWTMWCSFQSDTPWQKRHITGADALRQILTWRATSCSTWLISWGCRVRVSHSRFRLRSPVGQQGNVAKGAGHGDLAHYFRERPWKDVPAVLLDIDQIPEQESIKVS